ncbi:helix-turn-helix transcriptional regulator [Bradyrhizobium sp. 83012]|uniref:Helix-turn-helix transcriptional regulator n=1 Tax=Bradyrhizobium aeschynomenes TaxID=2734909 RepID=A0ABX2CNC3_9BRAD|nr:helix-turn-helix transcriptional regulator [Bradyrhizobium aeschynomenes]NPU15647.1 helix-turn-helix transcriptional regulator [Bradyrhizobium aeschynomenes]NPU69704.1 helix-turn-helix transcriptional regulator [Bradyrhizobium aeschynomenes]NPV24645.1 helix-turn-helix transcriptional regulator [Bradyrhizobium aeschynomenes]
MTDKLQPEVNSPPISEGTLGSRIRAVRTAKRLPLGDTANRIGVSRTSLHQWESDAVKNPDLRKLAAFTELADISLDWLLQGRGPPPAFLLSEALPKQQSIAPATENADSTSPAGDDVSKITEIAASMVTHARGFDLTPRATWTIPNDVLELGFNVEGQHALIKRLSRDSSATDLERGNYVLIDTSRSAIDEPGLYILSDPTGSRARCARAEFSNGLLEVTLDGMLGNDDAPSESSSVLGRIMGVFRQI